MDSDHARLYYEHMLKHLRTLRALFEHDLVPNHHLLLHLTACLILFGPVRGWLAYPFERYNDTIQRLNPDHYIGMDAAHANRYLLKILLTLTTAEIPLTFMRLFHAGAEVREMMSSTNWPESDEFLESIRSFNTVYRDAANGTRVSDIFGSIPSSAPTAFGSLFEKLDNARLETTQHNIFVDLVNYMYTLTQPFTTYDSDLGDKRSRLPPRV